MCAARWGEMGRCDESTIAGQDRKGSGGRSGMLSWKLYHIRYLI